MKQGNYKALIFKLFGSVLGLVFMLSVAVFFGQNIVADNSIYSMNQDDDNFSRSSTDFKELTSQEELALRFSMNEEFKIVVESAGIIANVAVKEARFSIENMQSENFKIRFKINSENMESLNEAIEKIAGRASIPSEIREEVLALLEQERAFVERKLNTLENHSITLSREIVLPQSKHPTTIKCNQKDIIVDECAKGDCTEIEKESNSKSERRGSIESFYWI